MAACTNDRRLAVRRRAAAVPMAVAVLLAAVALAACGPAITPDGPDTARGTGTVRAPGAVTPTLRPQPSSTPKSTLRSQSSITPTLALEPAVTPTLPDEGRIEVNFSESDLDAARARWEAADIKRYRIKVAWGQPLLGCDYEIVDVEDGQVVGTWRGRRDPLCVPSLDFSTFDPCQLSPADKPGLTVAKLFDITERLGNKPPGCPAGQEQVRADFDEAYGLPRKIVHSWSHECATDSPVEYAVIEFLPGFERSAPEQDRDTYCAP